MSAAIGLSAAQAGLNMYAQYRQSKAALKQYNRNLAITKRLAAEALAMTYNSILQKSMVEGMKSRRAEFELKRETLAAMGAATAQAASAGVTGRRADLAREQAILGRSNQEMAKLATDSKLVQDALIDRANMEERAAVHRLISNAPDMPSKFDPLISGLGGAAQIWGAKLENDRFNQLRQDNLVAGKVE